MLLQRAKFMRVTKTQAGGMYGGKFLLYKNVDIYMDLSSETDGDGSESNPINSFDTLFGDDELECTCQALCCDKITVRVRGEIPENSDDATGIDGNDRNYIGNLVIRPWGESETLQTDLELSAGDTQIIERNLFQNLHGVIFQDLHFVEMVNILRNDDGDDRLGLLGEINVFKSCKNLAFENCSLLIDGKVVVGDVASIGVLQETIEIKEEEEVIPWDSVVIDGDGGGGGGGGGWDYGICHGGDGGDGKSNNDHGVYGKIDNIFCTATGLRECELATVENTSIKIKLVINSSTEAKSQTFGILRSPLSEVTNSEIITNAVAYNSKGGEVTEATETEPEKIAGYDISAYSYASPVALCDTILLDKVKTSAISVSRVFPLNTPTEGEIAGISRSESYGVIACNNSVIMAASGAQQAVTENPIKREEITDGIRQCENATITGSSFGSYSKLTM